MVHNTNSNNRILASFFASYIRSSHPSSGLRIPASFFASQLRSSHPGFVLRILASFVASWPRVIIDARTGRPSRPLAVGGFECNIDPGCVQISSFDELQLYLHRSRFDVIITLEHEASTLRDLSARWLRRLLHPGSWDIITIRPQCANDLRWKAMIQPTCARKLSEPSGYAAGAGFMNRRSSGTPT